MEPFVDGLDSPLAAVNAGDGSGRIFVVEQGGLIRIVRDGKLLPEPFLDVSAEIKSGGERGLLGLAFHPDFPQDPRFFVDYTDTNGDTHVASFTVDAANPDRANAGSEQRLLFVDQPYANHNGGALAFGPDGDLYVALGDGGSGGDPHGNGQKLSTMLGKILRIDVGAAGATAYTVPPDNPFVSTSGAEPAIFLYGLRNPWRFSFDRATGDLWIGDVGQGAWEEVDVARAGTSGENYGWNRMEATHCFRPQEGCDESGLTMPVAEYSHSDGCTVIGGYVYRGSGQPPHRGQVPVRRLLQRHDLGDRSDGQRAPRADRRRPHRRIAQLVRRGRGGRAVRHRPVGRPAPQGQRVARLRVSAGGPGNDGAPAEPGLRGRSSRKTWWARSCSPAAPAGWGPGGAAAAAGTAPGR